MFINIKFKNIAIGINYLVAGDNRYSVNDNFFFIIRILAFINAHPEHDTAFSAAANLGLAYANHCIFAFFLKKTFKLFGDFW